MGESANGGCLAVGGVRLMTETTVETAAEMTPFESGMEDWDNGSAGTETWTRTGGGLDGYLSRSAEGMLSD